MSFKFYPNPVSDILNIYAATESDNTIVQIYDLDGRIISLPTKWQTNILQINTSSLTDGIYTFQGINPQGDAIGMGKFVRQ